MQYDNEASKCEVTAESVTVYQCNNVPSLGNKLLLPKALHAAGFFVAAQQAISTNKRC